MNVLRLPRRWINPLACPRNGTIRWITSDAPTPPAKKPLKFTKPTERLAPKVRDALFSTPVVPSSSKYGASRKAAPVGTQSGAFEPSNPDHLPWQVELSKSGNLPVYLKHRKSGTIEMTYIRKVKGDHSALAEDLSKFLGIPREHIRIKQPAGFLEIKGEKLIGVKEFLRLKGFKEGYESSLIT